MRAKAYALIITILISFSKLIAFDQEIIISQIKNNLLKEDAVEAYRWLTLLEELCPERIPEMRVTKSFLLGALGNEDAGRNLLLNNLALLRDKGFSDNQIQSIYNLFDIASQAAENSFDIIPCKGYQPKGLAIKYWIGAAALFVGIATAPFGNPASPWLMGTGAAVLLDTVPDLLENKEKYDNGLPPYDAETQRRLNEILQDKNH